MDRKYELILHDVKYAPNGKLTYCIRALKTFDIKSDIITYTVHAGARGGYIEHEGNLSHEGNCWVFDNARIYGDARIIDNAVVRGNATVGNKSVVCSNASVGNSAIILGDSVLDDSVYVYDNAAINRSVIKGNTRIFQNADVADSIICDNSYIYGNAVINKCTISGNTRFGYDVILKEGLVSSEYGQPISVKGIGDTNCIIFYRNRVPNDATIRDNDYFYNVMIDGRVIGLDRYKMWANGKPKDVRKDLMDLYEFIHKVLVK